MARKRATGVIVALTTVGTCLLHAAAWGLGLGELTPRSALNQSFRADIELVQVRSLEVAEIVPKLASREDFERLGVERFFFLTALDFKVDLSDRNNPVIRVTSATPVTEPYLNFVVEVLWPSGRLLKEYTVLLDPPVFSGRDAEPIAASAPAPSRTTTSPAGPPAGRADRPSGPQASARPSAPSAAAQPRRGDRSGGSYGATDRDDTLWEIALQARPEGGTVQQTMLAIVRMNPEAFIDGNINLLKAGYTLRLPSRADLNLNDREAVAEVARQNVAWQQRRTGGSRSRPAQLDAGGSTTRPGTATGDDSGSLRLVTGDPGATAPGSGATATGTTPRPASTPRQGAAPTDGPLAGRAAELADQLAVRDEEVDRLQRDKSELVARVGSLEAQLSQAEELRSANDARIAQMEAQIEELRRLTQARAGTPAQTPAGPAADSGGGMGVWLFGLLGLLVVGLLVAVLVMWRRLSEDSGAPILAEDEHLEDTQVVERTPARDVTSAAADANLESTEILDPEDHESPMDKTTVLTPEELPDAQAADGAESVGPETSDIIGEADIYIAYGRFPQAVSFLRNALDAEPDRNDVRLKLMEVFVETRDVDAFNAEGSALLESTPGEEELYRARQLQAKLPGASVIAPQEMSDDDVDMDATMIDTSVNVAEIARAAKGPSLDLDLNLEEASSAESESGAPPLDIDLNLDEGAGDVGPDEDGVDFELDIDMDDIDHDRDGLELEGDEPEDLLLAAGPEAADRLDQTGRTDLLADAADDAEADLGGDLGMDFEFEDDGDKTDLNETLGEFDLSGLDINNDGVEKAQPRASTAPGEDFESTIEKSIEKQLAEQNGSGEFNLDDLDFEEPAAEPGDGADDLSGLNLTIDGSSASLPPVARPPAAADDFDLDSLDADDDDGLSLTHDGGRDATTEMEVDAGNEFDLDSLDLDEEGPGGEGLGETVNMGGGGNRRENLDETVSMSSRGGPEVLDETVSMSDAAERLDATVHMDDDDDLGDDFDLGGDADEVQQKLELAQALIDSNDADGARDILSEVVEEGDEDQRDTASQLLSKLG